MMPWLFSLGMFAVWAVFLLLFVAVLIPTAAVSGLAGLVGGGFDPKAPAFWIAAGDLGDRRNVLWVRLSFKLRDIKFAETPDLFAARKRHAVRLFDEETPFSPAGRRRARWPISRPIRAAWRGCGGSARAR